MKKFLKFNIALSALLLLGACNADEYLNVLPEHVITSKTFWETEADAEFALSGVYASLRSGIFNGHDIDAWTPNAYAVFSSFTSQAIDATSTGPVLTRWRNSYTLISRANYFLENIDRVTQISDDKKRQFTGEAYFLRGLAYLTLVDSYGGVPLITGSISVDEARQVSRASVEDSWNQVISDLNMAIERLPVEATQAGRATKGSALGMKMRAYLYQGDYGKVLETVDEIDVLGQYSLFPSYEGLFKRENENNQEVLFDIQFISGPNSQGSGSSFVYLLPNFTGAGGGLTVPTQDLVDAYEMADGSAVDPSNPYEGRDPRLYFSVILEGTKIGDYVFNVEALNHSQQGIKHLAIRKFSDILINGQHPPLEEADLNFIVMRYAEVLLSKAEALIENGDDVDGAIDLINKIRSDRNDVKITAISSGLSQEEAREVLRHERRIEFAFEGLYWSDIRRWNIGPSLYPMNIIGTDGSILERRFINGYQVPQDNLLPIPDSERAMNENLSQNDGY